MSELHQITEIQKLERYSVYNQLDEKTKQGIHKNQERGASSWLHVLHHKNPRFTINKEELRDALALKYDRQINNLPSKCSCECDRLEQGLEIC